MERKKKGRREGTKAFYVDGKNTQNYYSEEKHNKNGKKTGKTHRKIERNGMMVADRTHKR